MSNIITAGNATNNGTSISSDTSGVLELKTGSSPTTAVTIGTNQVVTFAQQPAGTFAGTGPAFSAYPTSGQTLGAGSTTKILFPTELFDTNSNFASSRFTPTVAGYYQLNVNVGIAGGQSSQLLVSIFKNGSVYKHLLDENSSTYGLIGSCLVNANGSTDYFEVYVYTANGFTTSGSQQYTWFDGCMVRSA
jgi:hypothetical protein